MEDSDASVHDEQLQGELNSNCRKRANNPQVLNSNLQYSNQYESLHTGAHKPVKRLKEGRQGDVREKMVQDAISAVELNQYSSQANGILGSRKRRF